MACSFICFVCMLLSFFCFRFVYARRRAFVFAEVLFVFFPFFVFLLYVFVVFTFGVGA